MLNPYYEPYWVEVDSDSLEHYGVLGMKWGVRRYQNADGTLTAAGKKRVLKLREREVSKRMKSIRGELTDEEKRRYERSIRTYVSRMTLKDLERYSKTPMERATEESNDLRKASDALWKVKKLEYQNASPEKIVKYAEKAQKIIDEQYEDYSRLRVAGLDVLSRSDFEDLILSYSPPKWSKRKN